MGNSPRKGSKTEREGGTQGNVSSIPRLMLRRSGSRIAPAERPESSPFRDPKARDSARRAKEALHSERSLSSVRMEVVPDTLQASGSSRRNRPIVVSVPSDPIQSGGPATVPPVIQKVIEVSSSTTISSLSCSVSSVGHIPTLNIAIRTARPVREHQLRVVIVGLNYVGTPYRARELGLGPCYMSQAQLCFLNASSQEPVMMTDMPEIAGSMPTVTGILRALAQVTQFSRAGDTVVLLFYGVTERWIDADGRSHEALRCTDGRLTEGDIADVIRDAVEGVRFRFFLDVSQGVISLGLPWCSRWPLKPVMQSGSLVSNRVRDVILMSGEVPAIGSGSDIAASDARGPFTWALLQSLSEIHRSGRNIGQFQWKTLGQIVQYHLWTTQHQHRVRMNLQELAQRHRPLDVV
jgi:hypothetical protein